MTESATTSGALGHDHGYGPDIDHVLLSEKQIQAKIAELDRLVTDWHGQGPLHLPGGVRAGRDRAMLHLSADRPG